MEALKSKITHDPLDEFILYEKKIAMKIETSVAVLTHVLIFTVSQQNLIFVFSFAILKALLVQLQFGVFACIKQYL